MDLGIAGKHALVLGASRGLGAAAARVLAFEGAQVIAVARSTELTQGWRDELPADIGARIHPLAADLTQRAQVDRLVEQARQIGSPDILINNSGGPPPGSAAGMTVEQWSSYFQSMAAHLFHLTSRLLPSMLERGWGRVISIASSGVEQPIPNLALSNAIRAALIGWSKTLASEVAARGVTVNVVLPGRIHTDRVNELDEAAAHKQGKSRAQVAQESVNSIPAGRYGRPEEFGDVIAFLASARASYVTGSKIRVDGGMIRSI
jgi:3-oxoacyl-[acyl-carrier protein] reductase